MSHATPADFSCTQRVYMSTVWVQHDMRLKLRFEWKSQRPLQDPQLRLHSIRTFEAAGRSLPQSHVFHRSRFIFDSLTTVIQTQKLPQFISFDLKIFICKAPRLGQHLTLNSSSHVRTPPDHKTNVLILSLERTVSNMITGRGTAAVITQ